MKALPIGIWYEDAAKLVGVVPEDLFQHKQQKVWFAWELLPAAVLCGVNRQIVLDQLDEWSKDHPANVRHRMWQELEEV